MVQPTDHTDSAWSFLLPRDAGLLELFSSADTAASDFLLYNKTSLIQQSGIFRYHPSNLLAYGVLLLLSLFYTTIPI